MDGLRYATDGFLLFLIDTHGSGVALLEQDKTHGGFDNGGIRLRTDDSTRQLYAALDFLLGRLGPGLIEPMIVNRHAATPNDKARAKV